MPVSTKFKPSQERFHGKLPSRSVVDGSCTIDSKNELPLINVQAASNDCKINVLPGHQRRVGGYPVQDPQITCLPDLGKVAVSMKNFMIGFIL